jgi:glycosyltransferase involved in cell wall biosynthesis
MKVLWLMPYFGYESIGGAEISNLNYIHELNEFDHIVITNHFSSQPGQGEFEGVKFYNLHDDQILQCILNESPDLIICTHELVIFPFHLNIPYIIYLHDPRSGCSNLLTNDCNLDCKNCTIFNLHSSFYLPFEHAYKIICCSKYLIDVSSTQIKQKIHEEPVYPNIRISKLTNTLNPKVIGLSSVARHKGSDILEQLLTLFPDYKFITCGSNKLGKKFKNIEYIGYINYDEIHTKFYSRIGTYLSLAVNGEAFGMTIVEAFSNRIPVLFPYSDGLIESAGFDWFSIPYKSRNCISTWSKYLYDIVENQSIRDSMIKESSLVTQRYEQMKYESVSVLRELISNIP